MSGARRAFRGWVWLTASMSQRFLREGMVLRSLVFPVALCVTVLVGTVAAVTWKRGDQVALTPALATPAFRAAIEGAGGKVLVADQPEARVQDGSATLGTDGTRLWVGGGGFPSHALDAAVRQQIGAAWRPHDTHAARVVRSKANNGSTGIAQFIGALFAMYGVVFGAGAIARDRDDGTLDAELSVALPMWVTALARWSAATLVLGAFFAMSVAMLHAVIGIESPGALSLAGATAASTSAAIGMAVVGRGGKTRGFAGPMSAGLVIVTGVLSFGLATPALAPHLPIASLASGQVGAAPLVALVAGPLYAWWFQARVAVG